MLARQRSGIVYCAHKGDILLYQRLHRHVEHKVGQVVVLVGDGSYEGVVGEGHVRLHVDNFALVDVAL